MTRGTSEITNVDPPCGKEFVGRVIDWQGRPATVCYRYHVGPLTTALRDDPLCLLDVESRAWVEPEIQRLGRRFVVTDFEPLAVG